MAARAAASPAGDIRRWEGSIVQRGGLEWPTGASRQRVLYWAWPSLAWTEEKR